ncbi:hypothetical protein MVES1_000882 [Malassezia vespertilionis]|uniref:Uncharacterized protein n=1 Tax=Malassezia vespertilionis TaxID=2020962 RepID=A0A2N1JEB1_9BASI|nr:uncharacterized protein MVES1_000882 [Malassezia vespertilionis]PKI84889.1 hypothetical protein MVES_000830 [Malassezia vespertilionis]WFD05552.1 hypothetical protein MVES1_000882 [Malassezia vespertilionis]
MGADGGTIARRNDLVRTKKADEKGDKEELRHSLWTQCRLSKQSLDVPVVADRLGQLYNKEAVLEYMLRRGTEDASNTEHQAARHLKGLKDVHAVQLTPNPVAKKEEDSLYYAFACPLTQRVMNGMHKFVFLWTCGCVMSETGLRNTTGLHGRAQKTKAPVPCPVCGTPFTPDALFSEYPSVEDDMVWLYPGLEVQTRLREQLASKRKRKFKSAPSATESAKRPRPHLNADAPGTLAAHQVRAAQTKHAREETEVIASVHRKKKNEDVWLGKHAAQPNVH